MLVTMFWEYMFFWGKKLECSIKKNLLTRSKYSNSRREWFHFFKWLQVRCWVCKWIHIYCGLQGRTEDMAPCIPSGPGAFRRRSVCWQRCYWLSWQLNTADTETANSTKCNMDSAHYPISLLIMAGLEKGQQYSLGTGPLTLHSKKENIGNQIRARRLCW